MPVKNGVNLATTATANVMAHYGVRTAKPLNNQTAPGQYPLWDSKSTVVTTMMSVTHAIALRWPLHFVMADSNNFALNTRMCTV